MLMFAPSTGFSPLRALLALLWLLPIGFGAWGLVLIGTHQLQPRDFIGTERWVPEETYWATGDGREGRIGSFQAVLKYPSGTTRTHQIFPTQLHDEGWICVELRVGRWTQDYHIRLIRPSRC